jgi:hypothetical protein
MESWTEDLSTRERVRKIALSLTRPRSVNWIRTEADVASWDTTKSELDRLVEYGQLREVEDDSGTETRYRYGPNYRRRYLDRVEELATEHSKEELRAELAELRTEIEEWRERYGVDSADDLEASLTEADLTSDDIRERNRVIRQWRRSLGTERLIEHALALYDDLEQVTDGSSGVPTGEAVQ